MSMPVELSNDAALQAEAFLLGAVLQDGRIMAQYAHALEPGDFCLEKHRLVWQAFIKLNAEGRGIDIMSASAEIEKTGLLNSVFGGKSDYLFGVC